MIEINLLPGSGKKARSRGAGVDIAAMAAGVVARVKDPLLIGAVASVIVAGLAVGGMYVYQQRQTSSLDDALQKATQDSIAYSAVIIERRKVEAQRDSVMRQVKLIRSFDDKRFVWPHLMDEVSRALPPYTWITSIVQTNTVTAAQQPAAPPPPAADKKNGKAPPPPPPDTVNIPLVQFRIVGNTVDIQALTRFMKVLEASPFIQNVQLVRSQIVIIEGKEITEFQLDASYQPPDSSVIKLVPVSLSVR
ncbi:MAG TPA: PilN domain-containing protein [Gemmatimonadaceae bacterium]|nr:PilN domain-containing protein [Gemmatimonadaceae bacterium]